MEASMLRALVFLLASAPWLALAQPLTCQAIPVTCSSAACTAVSIAGGAFTTDAFNAHGYSTLKIVGNLTDASNEVSKLEHKLSENFVATGTFEAYPYCGGDAPAMDCGQLLVNWNPLTDGKDYTSWFPWRGRYGKLTVTPTGHGAGDVLRLELYGCY